VAKLPEEEGGYFGRETETLRRGLGVQIVVHLDDVDGSCDRVTASGHLILEPLQERPWGLRDFRISDPDGYYLRITFRPADNGRISAASVPSAILDLTNVAVKGAILMCTRATGLAPRFAPGTAT
jgi:hypothetical protein